jgi:hypothetical protein
MYWERTDGDIGWWSSERASVSLLANAIWTKGKNAALQEYDDKKSKEGKDYIGRPDLYATIGEYEFIAEAKQCWPWVPGKSPTVELWKETIRADFAAAVADAKCNVDYGIPRVGICFVAPRISDKYEDTAEALTERYREAEIDLSGIASSGYRADLFPLGKWKRGKSAFDLAECESISDTSRAFYPGCTLLIGFID